MITTTFFTCCNKPYQKFLPIFISSILFHNSDACVEVCVESLSDELKTIECIDKLKEKYQNRILIREKFFDTIQILDKTCKVAPNTVRFLTEPQMKNPYVYILDIDIIILESDITQQHVEYMNKYGIGYSNIMRKPIRKWFKKLTGCHFTKWDNYYPIPSLDPFAEKDTCTRDEVILHYIVSQKNTVREDLEDRLFHGLHISPNRGVKKVDNVPGWGVIPDWQDKWKNYRRSEEFLMVETFLHDHMKHVVLTVDKLSSIPVR